MVTEKVRFLALLCGWFISLTLSITQRMRVFDESIESEEHVTLLEDWCDTPVRAGDCINIAGKPESTSAKEYVVNNQKNVIILHPDRLISGTTVSQSFDCMRRAVLGTITKARALIYSCLVFLVFLVLYSNVLLLPYTASKWDRGC
jgi:hypothetical protein